MTLAFLTIILLSLALALTSTLNHPTKRPEDFFVAGGKFGVVLFFVLSVGETYSAGTILGYPAGIAARGTAFITWFVGYILLAFPIGYFLYPLLWRAGRRANAITLPDLFRHHFNSRALELTVTLTSLACLLPLGVMQFIGLDTILADLNWPIPNLALSLAAAAIAFAYIALSGIRAPAYVAILKDILILAAILTIGLACLAAPNTPSRAIPQIPKPPAHDDIFAITTILLQAAGFCIVPQTCAAVFTARSESTIRRAQIAMPLYMILFPFLTVAGFYAAHHTLVQHSPNDTLLAVSRALLPPWATGLLMAAAALSALVVLAGICLAIGPLVTRNLLPNLTPNQQRSGAKLVIAAYLTLSVAGAAQTPTLMVALNNLFYFGITQSLPGMLAIAFNRTLRPTPLIAGLLAGDALAFALHASNLPLGGINPGLLGLLLNGLIVEASTPFSRKRTKKLFSV
jgi:SSS family solute:Na+ symporter